MQLIGRSTNPATMLGVLEPAKGPPCSCSECREHQLRDEIVLPVPQRKLTVRRRAR